MITYERCRCTTAYRDDPTPAYWKDMDGDGVIEWCFQCDDGISLVLLDPEQPPDIPPGLTQADVDALDLERYTR